MSSEFEKTAKGFPISPAITCVLDEYELPSDCHNYEKNERLSIALFGFWQA